MPANRGRCYPSEVLLPLLLACGPTAVAWLTPRAALDAPARVVFAPGQPGQVRATTTVVANVGEAAGVWTAVATPPFWVSDGDLSVASDADASVGLLWEVDGWVDATGALVLTGPDGATTLELLGPVGTDADGDGHAHVDAGGDDCDDADPTTHPDAPDACYDGVDADCAANDDFDCDGDGWTRDDDCDDDDATIHPDAAERTNDADDNCDGRVDEHAWRAGDLWITEVRPAAPAWLELCSRAARTLNLAGLTLQTADGAHILGGAILAPRACAAVCANAVMACAITTPALRLNGRDALSVDADTNIDTLWIDDTFPSAAARALALDAEATGNDRGGSWCAADGTPGAPNPSCD